MMMDGWMDGGREGWREGGMDGWKALSLRVRFLQSCTSLGQHLCRLDPAAGSALPHCSLAPNETSLAHMNG